MNIFSLKDVFTAALQSQAMPSAVNLPTISSCALKNVKVTYGPDGMFNAFKNSGGMPTETTMELQFVELETLTRERLMEMEPTQEEVKQEEKEKDETKNQPQRGNHLRN